MIVNVDSAQARTERIHIRVTPDEKDVLEEYADIRGETMADLIRTIGIDQAVKLGRQVRERLAS